MAARKGHSKEGGRAKGTPNKVTHDLRTWIKMILDENIERVKDDFESLESKDRLIIFEKLLQYVIPRKKEEEIITTERDKFLKKLFGGYDDNEHKVF